MRPSRLIVLLILVTAPVLAAGSDAGTRAPAIETTVSDGLVLDQILDLEEAKPAWSEAIQAQTCCKICRKGKACGNSCIARWKTCHQPPGCACDATQ